MDDVSSVYLIVSGFVAVVVWAIRLEGKVKNTDNRMKENEVRDKETRDDVKDTIKELGQLTTVVESNKKDVEGLEKEIKAQLTGIRSEISNLNENFTNFMNKWSS